MILLTVVFALAPALVAQHSGAAPAVNVKTITRVPLPLSDPTVPIGGAMCDREGNVYARLLSAKESKERAGVFRLPIEEITPEGTLAKRFRVADASASDVFGKHIFVSSDGAVYQLAITAQGIYAIEFASDGSVKTKVKLEADPSVQAWDLAVFKAGGYLLTGETGRDSRTPYTAVFDADGRLARSVYEPEDEDARRKAESGDAVYAPSNRGNRFVSLGAATAGSDGNVYLLRGTSPALVYVISPKGEVVRKLRVDAGAPDFEARSIESYGDRLAIGFNGPTPLVIVTDLTGAPIGSYTVGGEGHLDLACFGPQGLTFIESKAGERSYLIRAQPQ